MTPQSSAVAYADFRKSSYFPSLNGIRAICALLVIKEHALWKIPSAPQMIEWGFLGVDMFFVISGFLIVTLLLRERDRSGRIDLKQFYVRRTLRIFPIYYLVIAGLFVLAVATYGHSTKSWDLYKWSFPIFLLYLQDLMPISMGLLFHTWSLAMEEQFYLIWPSVERFVRASFVVPLLVVLIVICQMCNFGIFDGPITAIYGPGGQLRPIFMITFTPILLGVLAAHAMHDARVGPMMTAALKNRWMPALLLGAAMLICQFSSALQGGTRLLVHVLFCLTLVAMVVNPRGVFSRVLQSRVMFYLGSISYGIYLYHTLLLWGIARAFEMAHIALSPPVLFLVCAPIAISIAALSFRYFETPIMALRHRKVDSTSIVTPAHGT